MIAVDTNVLVSAHREESPWHEQAVTALAQLGDRPWAIPWPCIHEFLAITTHPSIFSPPTPAELAREAVARWLSAPRVRMLSETAGYREVLEDLLSTSRVVGPRVHDARVAALCVLHGVETLWTADRDFSRFTRVRTVNPLLAP